MRTLFALLTLLLVLGTPAAAWAQAQPWSGESMIDDPEWRSRFLGSYGFLSGAEPKIDDAELLLLREVLELMKADPAAAAAMLEQQTALGGTSASLDFILANLKFQNGELDAAARFYQAALEKFPDFRRAHKNLGLLRVQQGDFAAGVRHLGKALELGDRDGRTYGLIGYCYVNLDNHLAAEQAYRDAILQQPDVKDWKLGLARSLLAMEEYREASALFDALIGADPDDSTLWLLQANALLGLDEPLAAAVNLEAVRMMGKAQPSSLVLLGDIYMNAGMYDFARSAYLDVVNSDQGVTQVQTAYRAADLLVRSRAWDDAQAVLDTIEKRYAGKLDEEQELARLTLEAKVARARGRADEAAKILTDIVERDGTRGDALLELASYYHDQGDAERAILMVERAQKLEDFAYPALLAHAQFRVTRREYAEAADLLRRAIQIKREPRVERFLARVESSIQP